MEQIVSVIQAIVTGLQWILTNSGTILGWIVKIVGIASALIALIPTLGKGNALLPIVKFIGKYVALNRDGKKDEVVRTALSTPPTP